MTTVTLTVSAGGSANSAANLSVIDSEGNSVAFVNNANGTYTFLVGRGKTATVTVNVAGYAPQTLAISAANTSTATYAATATLVDDEV